MSHRTTFKCPIEMEAINDFNGEAYPLYPTPKRAAEINQTIMEDDFWSENQAQYICDWDFPNVLEDVRFGAVYEDGQVWGVAYVRSSRELTEQEEIDLMEGITGQFSDGWGESFEQTEIHGDNDFYASFWNSSPSWKLVKVD